MIARKKGTQLCLYLFFRNIRFHNISVKKVCYAHKEAGVELVQVSSSGTVHAVTPWTEEQSEKLLLAIDRKVALQ